jgi:transcriptional regulator with XRE-family HTH domain
MDARHYDPRKLTEARELMGKSQQEIADEINVDRQTIYRVEAGKSASYDVLALLCVFYRVPITTIIRPFPLAESHEAAVAA